jgi:hypothetical protein
MSKRDKGWSVKPPTGSERSGGRTGSGTPTRRTVTFAEEHVIIEFETENIQEHGRTGVRIGVIGTGTPEDTDETIRQNMRCVNLSRCPCDKCCRNRRQSPTTKEMPLHNILCPCAKCCRHIVYMDKTITPCLTCERISCYHGEYTCDVQTFPEWGKSYKTCHRCKSSLLEYTVTLRVDNVWYDITFDSTTNLRVKVISQSVGEDKEIDITGYTEKEDLVNVVMHLRKYGGF